MVKLTFIKYGDIINNRLSAGGVITMIEWIYKIDSSNMEMLWIVLFFFNIKISFYVYVFPSK